MMIIRVNELTRGRTKLEKKKKKKREKKYLKLKKRNIFFFQNLIIVEGFNRNQSLGLLSSSVNLGGKANPLTAFGKRRFLVTCRMNNFA